MRETLTPSTVAGPLRVRLFAILLALIVTFGAIVSFSARDWATDDLAEALGGKAQQVLTEAQRVLTNAWGLGIPFDHEDVVHQGFDYFNRLLQDNPEVRFLAVADLDRTLFFYEGTNAERLTNLMADPGLETYTSPEALARGGSGDRAVAVGDFSIRVAPLLDDGQPVAALYVGIDRRIADRYFGPRAWVLGVALLTVAALAWLVVCFAVDRYWTEPASRLSARLAAARQDRWSIVNSRREGGEFRGVARAMNLMSAALRDRHDDAMGLAEEIRTQALDPSVAEEAARIRAKFEAELPISFPTGETPDTAGVQTASQRFAATLCLAISGALLLPILPSGAGVMVTAGIGLLAGLVASRFVTTMILAAFAATVAAGAALILPALPGAGFALALAGGVAAGLPLAAGLSAVAREGLTPHGWPAQTVAATVAGLAAGILVIGLADVASLPIAPSLSVAGALLLGPALILLLVTATGRRHAIGEVSLTGQSGTAPATAPATEVRDAA